MCNPRDAYLKNNFFASQTEHAVDPHFAEKYFAYGSYKASIHRAKKKERGKKETQSEQGSSGIREEIDQTRTA